MYLPSGEIPAPVTLPLLVSLVIRGGFIVLSCVDFVVGNIRIANTAEPTMHTTMKPVKRFRRIVLLRVKLRKANRPEDCWGLESCASSNGESSEHSSVTTCVRVTFSKSSV